MGECLNIMWRPIDRSGTAVCLATKMHPNDANVNWKSRDNDTVSFTLKLLVKLHLFIFSTLDFTVFFLAG